MKDNTQVIRRMIRGDDLRALSDEARVAACEFYRVLGKWPRMASVPKMPKDVEDLLDVDIEIEDGIEPMALVECADVPLGFVVVF